LRLPVSRSRWNRSSTSSVSQPSELTNRSP
jgi:hypothetical protein